MPGAPQAADVEVRYEGAGTATEIWGSSQANFLVSSPGHHAREVAVLLNDAAAAYLAAELGRADDHDFREQAARLVGQIWLERKAAEGGQIDAVVMVSRHLLESAPGCVPALKKLLTQ
jgi:hypothetical protein